MQSRDCTWKGPTCDREACTRSAPGYFPYHTLPGHPCPAGDTTTTPLRSMHNIALRGPGRQPQPRQYHLHSSPLLRAACIQLAPFLHAVILPTSDPDPSLRLPSTSACLPSCGVSALLPSSLTPPFPSGLPAFRLPSGKSVFLLLLCTILTS